MQRLAWVAILAVAACAAPRPPTPDPRVAVLADAGIVVPQPPHVSVNATGFTRVSLELVNPTGHDLVVEATTDWFDTNLHAIGGVLSAPKRLAVPRLGTAELELVSPTQNAVTFRIHIESGA